MAERKKIYYLLSKAGHILPNSGDSITEISIMTALSKNYDVYYNNQLFIPSKKDYGLKNIKANCPDKHYDLHIVRANPDIFNDIRGKKIYFASPYDESSFESADYISTFTDSWTNKLINGYDFPYNAYPSEYRRDNVITIRQVIPDAFFQNKNYYKIKKFRKKFLRKRGNFVIGHFGRVSNSCYPHSFITVFRRLKKVYPNISVVFCGGGHSIKTIRSHHNFGGFDVQYNDMPYAISACDLILYNYRDGQGHVAGSMKILEAMARGVPVIAPKYDARIEELGEDYELFYPYEDICKTNAEPTQKRFSDHIERKMFRIIKKSIDEPQWLKEVGIKLEERAKFFSVDSSADRLKKIIDKIIDKKNE